MMKQSIFLLFLVFSVCSSQRCKSEWKAIRGKCYRFFEVNVTWKQGEDYCVKHFGAHLASVPDTASLVELASAGRRNPTAFWIGGRWNGASWTWTDKTECAKQDEPINPNHMCAELYSGAYRPWAGADCEKKQPVMCVM